MTRLLYTTLVLAGSLLSFHAAAQNDPGATVGDTGTVSFTYRGNTITYVTVRAADNKIWLQQNLGTSARASSATDTAGYGHLFQWGRWDDGHQLRNSTVASPSSLSANNPSGLGTGSASFYNGNNPNDWWSAGSGTDTWSDAAVSASNGKDPCSVIGPGWHMPSQPEWANVITLENITNVATGFASNLRLTAAGMREANLGNLLNVGLYGNYWANTPSGIYAKDVTILDNSVNNSDDALRSYGFSVRCMATCTGVFPPQLIIGSVAVCPQSMQSYSVPPVSNANGYIWTVPAGWTISGPSNGNTINVMTGTTSGVLSVAATNSCGTSTTTIAGIVVIAALNPVITASGNTMSTGSFSTYQWLFNEAVIAGATGQSYTATNSGNYKVRVTDGAGCIDTSSVFNLTVTGIEDRLGSASVSIYPNPASTVLHISTAKPLNIHIYSLDGRLVLQQQKTMQADIRLLPAGMYQVRLSDLGGNLLKIEKLAVVRP